MANPKWVRELSEVLGYPTKPTTLTSAKTGNEYTTDIIPQLKVLSNGLIEENGDGKFSYSVVDTSKKLEYTIKTGNKIADLKFGNTLLFHVVRGGMTGNGRGWYAADSVEVVNQNA